MKKLTIPIFAAFLILLIDQILKIWIKTNMHLGESYHIAGNWFIIHFIENRGMAFGWTFGDGSLPKILLTTFRIVFSIIIAWAIYNVSKQTNSKGFLVSCAFIWAGAVGNIIDSIFYGKLFSHSSYNSVAEFLPAEGGYAGWLQGNVVDMFYFPIIRGQYPAWFPMEGDFEFFRPVFNIADAAITVGVFMLLLFYRKQLEMFKEEKPVSSSITTE